MNASYRGHGKVFHSQVDRRWERVHLGTSLNVIGYDGSLLCCLSSLLATYGIEITPPCLNRYLVRKGKFHTPKDITFDCLQDFGFQLLAVGTVENRPTVINRIVDLWQCGYEIILKVPYYPVGTGCYQWVWLQGVEDDDFTVFSPHFPPDVYPVVPLMCHFAKPQDYLHHTVRMYLAYRWVWNYAITKECTEASYSKGN